MLILERFQTSQKILDQFPKRLLDVLGIHVQQFCQIRQSVVFALFIFEGFYVVCVYRMDDSDYFHDESLALQIFIIAVRVKVHGQDFYYGVDQKIDL